MKICSLWWLQSWGLLRQNICKRCQENPPIFPKKERKKEKKKKREEKRKPERNSSALTPKRPRDELDLVHASAAQLLLCRYKAHLLRSAHGARAFLSVKVRLATHSNCSFLGATKHLFKRVCPSVGPSVRRSVTPSLIEVFRSS